MIKGLVVGCLLAVAVAAGVTGCGESVTFGSDDGSSGNLFADSRTDSTADSSDSSDSSADSATGGTLTQTTSTTVEPEYEQQFYEVQRGETLISIADKFGIDLNALVNANNIANPRLIYVGQKLIIPPPPDEADRPALTLAPPTNPSLPPVLATLAPASSTTLWIGN